MLKKLWDPSLGTLQRSKTALAAVGFGARNPDLQGSEAAAGNHCHAWVEGAAHCTGRRAKITRTISKICSDLQKIWQYIICPKFPFRDSCHPRPLFAVLTHPVCPSSASVMKVRVVTSLGVWVLMGDTQGEIQGIEQVDSLNTPRKLKKENIKDF